MPRQRLILTKQSSAEHAGLSHLHQLATLIPVGGLPALELQRDFHLVSLQPRQMSQAQLAGSQALTPAPCALPAWPVDCGQQDECTTALQLLTVSLLLTRPLLCLGGTRGTVHTLEMNFWALRTRTS